MLSEQGRFVIKCEYTIDSHLLMSGSSAQKTVIFPNKFVVFLMKYIF